MILRSLSSFAKAIHAFVKAYDDTVGLSSSGFPMIRQWPEHDCPYDYFLSQSRNIAASEGRPVCAFVFKEGKNPGEIIYLREGHYQLGSSCLADIVTSVETATESTLTVEVGPESLKLKSDQLDLPVFVNQQELQEVELVDQDEVAYNGASFAYLDLRNIEGDEER